MTDPTTEVDTKSRGTVDAGPAGKQVIVTGWFVRAFGQEQGFGVTLVAFGIAFASCAMAARLDEFAAWGLGEFLAALGFGALMVVLGCVDRLRVQRKPSVQPPAPELRLELQLKPGENQRSAR